MTADLRGARGALTLVAPKRPSYGVTGTTKAEFCYDHKKAGMVNVRINK